MRVGEISESLRREKMTNILKEVNKEVTECCGRTPLIEVHDDNSWSLWEFCPDCLKPSELINAKDYNYED